MAKLNLIQAIQSALMVEMERDSTVMVLGEDVGKEGGVFRATEGLQERFGPHRVVDTPLAESGIVGVALGLALNGMKPVAEIQFDGFMPPAWDQLISHVSRMRTRSRGRFGAPLVVRIPYGGGIKAPEHHSEATEAVLVHTPGLKVVYPATPFDAKGLLISAIRDPDPVVFLEPKRIYRAFRQEVPDGAYTIPIGEARVVRKGKDLTAVTWGAMVREVEKAAQMAESEGMDVEIVDLRTLSPMDDGAFLSSVKRTGRAVVVHEAPRTCGLGAEIAARIQEEVLLNLKAPVVRVTGFDVVTPLAKLEHHFIPSPERILKAFREVISF